MQLRDIITQLKATRDKTTQLTASLAFEDHVVQPMEDVSPPKWHLAHTTWFFETFILKPNVKGYKLFHKQYSYLFNSYYEHEGERVARAHRGFLSRPTVKEILQYRAYVDEILFDWLEKDCGLSEEIWSVVLLGIHHEKQHQELFLTDIKYILGGNPLFPAFHQIGPANSIGTPQAGWLGFEGGLVEMGYGGDEFCFDNEKEPHPVYLQPFEIQDRLITNGEFLEFVNGGGYQQFEWWLAEAWDWIQKEGIRSPLYWHKLEDDWHEYHLSGLEKLDPHQPVTHISYFEAEAFASWKNLRLPTEFEWELAARKWGSIEGGNFQDDARYQPMPRLGNNNQLFGDAWEWTESAYLAYPHYKKSSGAIGEYNGKFMVNQKVLRGGSCVTSRDHIRPTYRNFFKTDKRWQFTAIRLARYTQ